MNKLTEFIKDMLYEIDFFGVTVSLRWDGEPSANTLLGGMLSFALSIALVVMFFSFGSDWIYKTNPKIAVETRYLDSRPNIHLSRDTLPIAFGWSGEGSDYILVDGVFSFVAEILYNDNTDPDFEMEATEWEIKRCEEKDFPWLFDSFGDVAKNWYCIEDFTADIYGYFDDDAIQYWSIRTSVCDVNEDSTCAPLDDILERFEENTFYFNIFFIDTTINLQNYTVPSQSLLKTIYQGMSSLSYKYMEIALKNQRYETNDILIFDNNISESSVAYETHDFGDTNIGADYLWFDCMIISSNVFTINYRTYDKISDVLANVGGVSSVVLVVCEAGCYFFARTRRNEEIWNGIFEYDWNEYSTDSNKMNVVNNKIHWRGWNSGFIGGGDNHSSSNMYSSKHGIKHNIKNHDDWISIDSQSIKSEDRKGNRVQQIHWYNPDEISNNIELISIKPKERKEIKDVKEGWKYGDPPDSDRNEEQKEVKESNNLINFPIKKAWPNEIVTNILKIRDAPTQKIHFNIFDVLTLYTCRCFAKKKSRQMFTLYRKTEPIWDELLDIRVFVRKWDELEKLKLILFNENQLAMFNFISKDLCSLDSDKLAKNKMYKFKKKMTNWEDLGRKVIQYLEDIQKKGEEVQNPIDKKLTNLLQEEVKTGVKKLNK